MSQLPNVEITECDGMLIARVRYKSIDYLALEQIKRAVDRAISRSARRPLILDLAQVEHVSSLVMGAIVELLRQLAKRDQRLMLVGMNQRIRSAFAVTRIEQLFEIYDDCAGAVKAAHQDAWHPS